MQSVWLLYRKQVYVSHQMYFGVVTRVLNSNWNNFLGLFVEGAELSRSFALGEVVLTILVNKMDVLINSVLTSYLLRSQLVIIYITSSYCWIF